MPPDPDAFRLAELERAREVSTLTPDEEAEYIALLAKVKGVHDTTPEKVPHGFSSVEQFEQAGRELKSALAESGIKYSEIGVRGSSVTGISSKGGEFRVSVEGGLPASDVDIYINLSNDIGINPSKNIPGFIHPDKLLKRYPALQQWSDKWSTIMGREITPGAFLPGTFTDKNTITFK